jgi:hypothetical protein
VKVEIIKRLTLKSNRKNFRWKIRIKNKLKIKKDSNSLSLPNYEPLRNELSRILEIKD